MDRKFSSGLLKGCVLLAFLVQGSRLQDMPSDSPTSAPRADQTRRADCPCQQTGPTAPNTDAHATPSSTGQRKPLAIPADPTRLHTLPSAQSLA